MLQKMVILLPQQKNLLIMLQHVEELKAADIAGAIFHHKDDKKGQGSTFTFWFENEAFPLPSKHSPVRYGSHCEAASVLMEYHDAFLRFLELFRDAKDCRHFSNMKKNLYTALKCNATLTELATLALYGQAITPAHSVGTYRTHGHPA